MSDPHDTKTSGAAPAAAIPFHEASDDFVARFLGRDLQGATLRVALYVAVACVVFATIAVLVG
jgi:hypothetical protein